MLAPIGLVLGAPMTLALKTLPLKISRIISSILGSLFFHSLRHPVTAAAERWWYVGSLPDTTL